MKLKWNLEHKVILFNDINMYVRMYVGYKLNTWELSKAALE
jgi:hypothetical protein